jgi:hypothetical protein
MGSKTLRAACGTKRRVCRSFCAWTDGALNVVAAAAAAAPWIACRRLIRLILEFLLATAVTPPGEQTTRHRFSSDGSMN